VGAYLAATLLEDCSVKRYHSDKHFLEFYRQDGVKNQLEQNYITVTLCVLAIYPHCFDTVGHASGRASRLQKLSDELLVWLSVWSEVQIVCTWSS